MVLSRLVIHSREAKSKTKEYCFTANPITTNANNEKKGEEKRMKRKKKIAKEIHRGEEIRIHRAAEGRGGGWKILPDRPPPEQAGSLSPPRLPLSQARPDDLEFS